MADKYRYFITYNAVDRQVFPIGLDKVEYDYEQPDDCTFFRKLLSGSLTFINRKVDNNTDFDYFYEIELAAPCDTISFRIEALCDGLWTVDWTGRFSTGKGKFDLNKCEFTVKAEVVDRYTCVLDYWETELNVLSGATRYSATSTIGTVHTLEHFETIENGVTQFSLCQIDNVGIACVAVDFSEWCFIADESTVDIWDDGAGNIREDRYSVYRREQITTACTGSVCPDDCTPPIVGEWTVLDCNCPTDCEWWRCNSHEAEYDRLMRVDEIIERFLEEADCELTYRSIFFNRNPDTSDPVYINDTAGGTLNYWTGLATRINHLMLSQKTDIKFPNATDPAVTGMWTLRALLRDLFLMFKATWDIDDDGNFKIEHISYFPRTASTIDLSDAAVDFERFKKMEVYEHRDTEIPEREEFHWMDEVGTAGTFFKGVPIIYNSVCATKGKIQDWSVEDITTDLEMISTFTNDIDDDGFVMLHCVEVGGDYYIDTDSGRTNGHLSWTRLHENYHKIDRYLPTGNMNGVPNTVFDLPKPNVKQVVLSVRVCCGDVFDPQNTFLPVIGTADYLGAVGRVLDAKFNMKTQILKLTLGYSI